MLEKMGDTREVGTQLGNSDGLTAPYDIAPEFAETKIALTRLDALSLDVAVKSDGSGACINCGNYTRLKGWISAR